MKHLFNKFINKHSVVAYIISIFCVQLASLLDMLIIAQNKQIGLNFHNWYLQ